MEFETNDEPGLGYQPGDHMAIFPANVSSIVDAILMRVPKIHPDKILTVQVKQTEFLSDGTRRESWVAHDRLPPISLRVALTRYLDITTPPTQHFLSLLVQYCVDDIDKKNMELLVIVSFGFWQS